MEGTGIITDPYIVKTATDLNTVRDNLEAYYLQDADIDLSSYENWVPIGDGYFGPPFLGFYDGGGYSITNLNVEDLSRNGVGLFGMHVGGYIKNLSVSGIVKGNTSVGIIVGQMSDSGGTIENCNVSGTVEGRGYLGGLCGHLGQAYTVTNCHGANISIKILSEASDYVGGLFGFVGQGNNILDISIDNLVIEAEDSCDYVGGLTGFCSQNCIFNQLNSVNVTVLGGLNVLDYVGGAIGFSSHFSTFENCNIDVLNISSSSYVGGFAGFLANNNSVSHTQVSGVNIDVLGNSSNIGGGIGGSGDSLILESFSCIDINIISTFDVGYVGGFGGVCNEQGLLNNCEAKDILINISNSDSGQIGGFFSCIHKEGVVTDCHVDYATIQCGATTYSVGGFSGFLFRDSSYSRCSVKNLFIEGFGSSAWTAGGFAGTHESGIAFDQCYVKNIEISVLSSPSWFSLGGFLGCGYAQGNSFQDCYVQTAMLKGGTSIGGFLGYAEVTDIITNCYVVFQYQDSESVTDTGGFIAEGSATVTNSYYDSEISGLIDDENGEPKDTEEMKNILTYTEWNISTPSEYLDEIWILPNNGYPELAWAFEEEVIHYVGAEGIVLVQSFLDGLKKISQNAETEIIIESGIDACKKFFSESSEAIIQISSEILGEQSFNIGKGGEVIVLGEAEGILTPMLQISTVDIHNELSLDFLLITWTLKDTEETLDDYKFRIFRSFDYKTGFTPVVESDFVEGIDFLEYVDNTIKLYKPDILPYYRIEVTNKNTGAPRLDPKTAYVRHHIPDKYANVIVKHHRLALGQISSHPFYHLRLRRFGNRCSNCWDSIRKAVSKSNCEVCYSTGYEGGYYKPQKIKLQSLPYFLDTYSSPEGDFEKMSQVSGWTTNLPIINSGDLLIDSLNKRYKVLRKQVTTKGQYILRQVLTYELLPISSIVYKIDI